jgi:hypothetical protein
LFQGLPQKQAGGAGGAGGSGGAGGEQQAPQRRKSEQNVLADERAYNLSGDQIERILPAEKIQGFKQYMANQEKMMRQPPPVAESPASADEAEEKEDFGYAEQYLSDLVAGQKRDLDFIRVNVRPDGFLVNLYANEGEYFCAHSVHPAVPFARFVGSSGRRATQVIEAFATAFFEQQNEAHKSILGIDRIDWVRERLATGQSRVKRILVPVKDLERK